MEQVQIDSYMAENQMIKSDQVLQPQGEYQIQNQKNIMDRIFQTRWLKTSEVQFVLQNIPLLLQMGYPLQNMGYSQRPQSGQIFIFPYEGKSLWRKDFHHYLPRKNSTTTREDQSKLKMKGVEFAIVSYCQGSGQPQQMNDQIAVTPESFKRRAYWLKENPNYILVHYLDEANKYYINYQYMINSKVSHAIIPQEEELLQTQQQVNTADLKQTQLSGNRSKLASTQLTNSSANSCYEENLSISNPSSNNLAKDINYQLRNDEFENCSEVSILQPSAGIDMIDQFMIDLEIDKIFGMNHLDEQQPTSHNGADLQQHQEDLYSGVIFNQSANKPPGSQNLMQQNQMASEIQFNMNSLNDNFNQISFFSNQDDINQLQYQINGLYKRFENLEQNMKTTNQAQQITSKVLPLKRDNPSQLVQQQPPPQPMQLAMTQQLFDHFNIEIVDFSPEWDYTTGGSKLLVCIKPSQIFENLPFDQEQKFELGFGNVLVPITFIQPGVFKCNAPQHEPGFVELKLLFEGKVLTNRLNDTRPSLFEYRQQVPKSMKKKRIRTTQPSESLLEGDTREFKVRIVERLTFLEQRLNNPTNSTQQQNSINETSQIKELFSQVNNLDNEVLETLNREFIKRVMLKILVKMKEQMQESERLQLINQIDETGASLLHYVTALNYYEMIPILQEYGADVNIKSSQNLTPLMVAAAKGHEKAVKKLMRLGAALLNDPNTFTDNKMNYNNQSNSINIHQLESDNSDDSNDEHQSYQNEIRLTDIRPQGRQGKGLQSQQSFSRDNNMMGEDGALELALQNRHHGIVEMFLRDMTLKDAVRNDSVENSQANRRRENARYLGLDISSRQHNDSRNYIGRGNNSSNQITSPKNIGIALKRRAENSQSTEPSHKEPRYNILSKNFGTSNEELSKVQKIQRVVRAWILRRQHQDIKHATKLLHSELSNNLNNRKHNKIDEKQAAIIIQRTVRNWLKTFDQIE